MPKPKMKQYATRLDDATFARVHAVAEALANQPYAIAFSAGEVNDAAAMRYLIVDALPAAERLLGLKATPATIEAVLGEPVTDPIVLARLAEADPEPVTIERAAADQSASEPDLALVERAVVDAALDALSEAAPSAEVSEDPA